MMYILRSKNHTISFSDPVEKTMSESDRNSEDAADATAELRRLSGEMSCQTFVEVI